MGALLCKTFPSLCHLRLFPGKGAIFQRESRKRWERGFGESFDTTKHTCQVAKNSVRLLRHRVRSCSRTRFCRGAVRGLPGQQMCRSPHPRESGVVHGSHSGKDSDRLRNMLPGGSPSFARSCTSHLIGAAELSTRHRSSPNFGNNGPIRADAKETEGRRE